MRSMSFHALPRAAAVGTLAALLTLSVASAQTTGGYYGGGATGGGATGGGATGGRTTGGGTTGGGTAGGGTTGGGKSTAPTPTPTPTPAPASHGPALEKHASPAPPEICGQGGLTLQQPAATENPTKAVAELSRATRKYIEECRCDDQQCIADALDKYAQALAVVAPRLPKPLRNLPKIVAEAAHRVRVAATKAEAIAALDHAIAAIHKDISLVRSEEVGTAKRDTRSGELVAGTLNVASVALVNSGGL